MALAECLLVDADTGDLDGVVPGESTGHSPLKDMPRLIPTDSDQGTSSLHYLARLEDVDDKSLHEKREAAVRLVPRHLHLHAVLGAFSSRDTGMAERR